MGTTKSQISDQLKAERDKIAALEAEVKELKGKISGLNMQLGRYKKKE